MQQLQLHLNGSFGICVFKLKKKKQDDTKMVKNQIRKWVFHDFEKI